MCLAAVLCVQIVRDGCGILGAEAAGLIGVAAIVADEVLALVGDMLDEFCQEIITFINPPAFTTVQSSQSGKQSQ